jgi:FkbM family methyltransferase
MYVDRYRFAQEPEALAGAEDGAVRALFRGGRGKAGMAVRLLRAFPEVRKAYRSLRNKESRALFRDLLRYRVAGPYFTRIANNRELYQALEHACASEPQSEPLTPAMSDFMGNQIALWTVPYRGRSLQLLGSKVATLLAIETDQYYYRAGDVAVQPEQGDVVLDGGAYLGEMSLRFAVDVGPTGQVIGFDPSPRNCALARDTAQRNGLGERTRFVAAGLGAKSNVAALEETDPPANATSGAPINAGTRVTKDDKIITVDDYCAWSGLDRVNLLKMDIEGSEIAALDGSRRTIDRHRPKLAVCLYHRYDDLWKIPNLIRERHPFYDFYLGHHTLHAEETVLYGLPRS